MDAAFKSIASQLRRIGLSSLLLVSPILAMTAVLPADPEGVSSSCPSSDTIATPAQIQPLVSGHSGCDLSGLTIEVSPDHYVAVPRRGTGAVGAGVTAAGDTTQAISFQDQNGAVFAAVDGHQIGDAGILPPTLAARLQSGSPVLAVDRGSVAPKSAAAAVTTRCSTAAASDYNFFGGVWNGTYDYWYNPSNAEGSNALTLVNVAALTWINGLNSCGGNVTTGAHAAYQTTTNIAPAVSSNASCPGDSGHSVVGWGTLAGYLAYTCDYVNLIGLWTEADIRIGTNTSFFVGSGTACSGQYDLLYTLTHEMGHAFGLAHSSSSYDQTMMASQGYCQLAERKLGAGDLAGIRDLY